jgi:hypothetical protein
MTPTHVEKQLHEAMHMLSTVEEYEAVIQEMFDEQSYTLFRGSVLYAFTRALMKILPLIAPEIRESYHTFLCEHFDPLYVTGLLLD